VLFHRTIKWRDRKGRDDGKSKLKLALNDLVIKEERARGEDRSIVRNRKESKCMLLDVYLPDVKAAHLFKFEWEDIMEDIVGISHGQVDSAKNGLLLYKPLEWAYDNSILAFIYESTSKRYKVFLVDKSYSTKLLVDVADTFNSKKKPELSHRDRPYANNERNLACRVERLPPPIRRGRVECRVG